MAPRGLAVLLCLLVATQTAYCATKQTVEAPSQDTTGELPARFGRSIGCSGQRLPLLCFVPACTPPGYNGVGNESKRPHRTVCPSGCLALPAKQRAASALAVSLVAFVGCDGNMEGAARAIISAASSGDTDAFSAGMSVGAATLTGERRRGVMIRSCACVCVCTVQCSLACNAKHAARRPTSLIRQIQHPRNPKHPDRRANPHAPGKDNSAGQMAEALSETFTVANAGDKAKAVASAVGNAIQAMSGAPQAAMIEETIASVNDLADSGQCGLAATTAFGALGA